MLKLEQIDLRRGPRLLLESVSFEVHAGHRIGLVGANGSGKSSLLALVLGQLESDAGDCRLAPGITVAHVAQSLPEGKRTALDYVIDGDSELREVQKALADAERDGEAMLLAELHGRIETIDGYRAEARAGRLLHGLGFDNQDLARPVGAFSGGWRVRLNLAQALMCRSDLLLLDEPTNHLDLPAILWLEQWLQRYAGGMLVISHDRDFMDAVCNQVAAIEQQHIELTPGNYSQYERLRTERLAHQQAHYERQQKEVQHLQQFIDRFRAKASKARQAQSRIKALERMTLIAPAHVDSPFRMRFFPPPRQPQHLLGLDQASLGYEQAVLQGVQLSLGAGDRLGILGLNGAGKSTLVRGLADGSTLLDGERHCHRDTRIGYFAQHQLELLDPAHSALQHLLDLDPDARQQDLVDFLGRFGFAGDRVEQPIAPFSGGEKSRLVLALLTWQRPNLLLLDEPTNHLDLDMRQALTQALQDFDGAVLVISHDRHLLRSTCDEFLLVHDGALQDYAGDLDDYSRWVLEQDAGSSDLPAESRPVAASGGRAQRQERARERQRLQPLQQALRQVERQIENTGKALASLEQSLADPDLYADKSRADEVTRLMQQQGQLRQQLSDQEEQWLEAQAELEAASEQT